jgi:hypothetical protein
MNAGRISARMAGAVILSVAALGLGWRLARIPGPARLALTRCPIHGIAYDAELEACPNCAKPAAVGGRGGAP